MEHREAIYLTNVLIALLLVLIKVGDAAGSLSPTISLSSIYLAPVSASVSTKGFLVSLFFGVVSTYIVHFF